MAASSAEASDAPLVVVKTTPFVDVRKGSGVVDVAVLPIGSNFARLSHDVVQVGRESQARKGLYAKRS
jgi:hypothetical protein